ncbi:MAG: Dabb family protein [Christensenellaceae bacterium]|jgi:hypothetical protein
MVRHVVCQKFENKEDAKTAAEMLRALPEKIEPLLSMEVGLDFLGSERSFDLVLIATFADEAGLHAYDEHPEHAKVRAFIRPRRVGTVSVDYIVEA